MRGFNGRILFREREREREREMRKRKGSRSASASTTVKEEEEEEEAEALQQKEEGGSEGRGFFACYLLASLNPRFKGHTYIGFTVNPRRRIRQHNGEIGCGAWRTKKRRPWEMVLCIYGFPTNVSALQFEWAWQHPVESLAVRKAAASFKSLSGVANKIRLAYTMLTLPSWHNMNITVNFFSTKYMKHCAGCPSLPEHMKVEIGSMDELPCYTERIDGFSENEDDAIDEVEIQNNTSTSDSVLDACNDSITCDSDPNHVDKSRESFAQSQESEAREPSSQSLASQESFGSITSPMLKSSPAKRLEIIEDTDYVSEMNKSGAEYSQQECEQSGAALASNKNGQVNSTFIVPHETEIIDLSTPSPCCRNILDSKKRIVSSSVGTDFIDLTKSPNFVQL